MSFCLQLGCQGEISAIAKGDINSWWWGKKGSLWSDWLCWWCCKCFLFLFLVIFIRINESRITGHSLGAKICCIYFTAFDFEGRNSLPLLAKKLASFFFFLINVEGTKINSLHCSENKNEWFTFLGNRNVLFSSSIVNLIASFLVDQDLAGDVVQNLKDFFRTFYKKVILSGFASFLFSCTIILVFQ